jgi:hypothetical protein
MAVFFLVRESELIYEIRPGHIEGWEKVSWLYTNQGARIEETGHNYRNVLEPTPFVLASITRILKSITPEQIRNETVKIGTRGQIILERIKPSLIVLPGVGA